MGGTGGYRAMSVRQKVLGPLTGGSRFQMLIIRNINVALSNFRNVRVTLSILRNDHVPYVPYVTIFLKAMSHVTKPQKGPCRRVDVRGLQPWCWVVGVG